MKTDNVVITGATGFLGQNLLKHPFFENDKGYIYNITRSSLWNEETLKQLNPKYIFHLAGEIYDEYKMFSTNIEFTYKLLNWTKNIPYKVFIYVGSSSEYGTRYQKRENAALLPTNLYDATKGCSTLLCQAFAAQYKKPIAIVRPFSVYGSHDKSHKFIPSLFRAATKNTQIIVGKGSHDWIHVDDFVDGFFKVVSKLEMQTIKEHSLYSSPIFNLGTGIQITNFEVVNMFEQILRRGIKKKLIEDRIRKYDNDNWVADMGNSHEMLTWTPKISLYSGLKLEWERFLRINT